MHKTAILHIRASTFLDAGWDFVDETENGRVVNQKNYNELRDFLTAPCSLVSDGQKWLEWPP